MTAPAVTMISFTHGLKLPTAVSAGSCAGKSGAIKASVDKACRSGSYKEVWADFVGAWLLSITITAPDENILPFFFPLHPKTLHQQAETTFSLSYAEVSRATPTCLISVCTGDFPATLQCTSSFIMINVDLQ